MVRITFRQGMVLALGLAMLSGCQQNHQHLARQQSAPAEKLPHLSKTQLAEMQVAWGRTLEKEGDLEHAGKAYQEALAKNPKLVDAYARLALLADKQGRFTESGPLYRKAIDLQPDNADLHCNLGYSLYLQQDWEAAQQSLTQAIHLKPDHARAHNNLGLVLARTGRHQEALAAFRRAGCTESDAHNNLGHGLTLAGALPQAKNHYQVALKADPESVNALRGLQSVNALLAKQPATEQPPVAFRSAARPTLSMDPSRPVATGRE
jgi:Tfp pilus assembly protein PilF